MRIESKDGHTGRKDFEGVDEVDDRWVHDKAYASDVAVSIFSTNDE